MSRYIYVDKLIKDGWKLRREKHGLTTITFETMELDCVSPADVRENRHGEWVHKDGIYGVVFCSECDYELHINNTNYCPNCGALMSESLKIYEVGKAIAEGLNEGLNCGADMRPSLEIRDCDHCKHYVTRDGQTGCEKWECEFERR